MADRGQVKTAAVAALVLALALAITAAAEPAENDADRVQKLVRSARAYVGLPVRYDGRYRVIRYPGGDPGGFAGACSDLVIRAYRGIGVDLQVLVHEDMKKNFDRYPAKKLYDQNRTDTNIDHRRVPNLLAFFKRNATSLTTSPDRENLEQWRPGDIVIFDLVGNDLPSHVAIVSDKKNDSGRPLIIHHFPLHPSEDDSLTKWKIIGHFRFLPPRTKTR